MKKVETALNSSFFAISRTSSFEGEKNIFSLRWSIFSCSQWIPLDVILIIWFSIRCVRYRMAIYTENDMWIIWCLSANMYLLLLLLPALLHIHSMCLHNNYICISFELGCALFISMHACKYIDLYHSELMMAMMMIEEQFGVLTFKSKSKQNTWSECSSSPFLPLFFGLMNVTFSTALSIMSHFILSVSLFLLITRIRFDACWIFKSVLWIKNRQNQSLWYSERVILRLMRVICHCYDVRTFIVGFGLLVCKVHQSFYAHITRTFSLPIYRCKADLIVSTLSHTLPSSKKTQQTMSSYAYMFALMLLPLRIYRLFASFFHRRLSLFCYMFYPVGNSFDWSDWIRHCDGIVCTSNFGRIILFCCCLSKRDIFTISRFFCCWENNGSPHQVTPNEYGTIGLE